MSSAEKFYTRHYGGNLGVGATPLDRYEADMLRPGGRYHLPVQHFEAQPPHGKRLAEVGCGGAEALILLAQRYNFRSVIGVDVALPAGSDSSGVSLIKGDLDQCWPLDDRSVDYLLAMMVIEHLYDPFHAFAEVARVLAPDGIAFINLPLVTALPNRVRLAVLGEAPITSTSYDDWFRRREWDGNHLHYFSMGSIRRLAAATGLGVRQVRGVGRFSGLKSALPGLLAAEVTFGAIRA